MIENDFHDRLILARTWLEIMAEMQDGEVSDEDVLDAAEAYTTSDMNTYLNHPDDATSAAVDLSDLHALQGALFAVTEPSRD
jgi:hypothetical protein